MLFSELKSNKIISFSARLLSSFRSTIINIINNSAVVIEEDRKELKYIGNWLHTHVPLFHLHSKRLVRPVYSKGEAFFSHLGDVLQTSLVATCEKMHFFFSACHSFNGSLCITKADHNQIVTTLSVAFILLYFVLLFSYWDLYYRG